MNMVRVGRRPSTAVHEGKEREEADDWILRIRNLTILLSQTEMERGNISWLLFHYYAIH